MTTKEMPSEWQDYTIRMKKDPEWPYHGTQIVFNDCPYHRDDKVQGLLDVIKQVSSNRDTVLNYHELATLADKALREWSKA